MLWVPFRGCGGQTRHVFLRPAGQPGLQLALLSSLVFQSILCASVILPDNSLGAAPACPHFLVPQREEGFGSSHPGKSVDMSPRAAQARLALAIGAEMSVTLSPGSRPSSQHPSLPFRILGDGYDNRPSNHNNDCRLLRALCPGAFCVRNLMRRKGSLPLFRAYPVLAPYHTLTGLPSMS